MKDTWNVVAGNRAFKMMKRVKSREEAERKDYVCEHVVQRCVCVCVCARACVFVCACVRGGGEGGRGELCDRLSPK